jgi:transcriptional repressor NrdR
MNCPHCGKSSRVVDSRPVPQGIRRRRECLSCRRRFTTYEKVVVADLKVIKSRGRLAEEFDLAKLKKVAMRVCRNTSISAKEVDGIISKMESDLAESGKNTITSAEIASILLGELQVKDSLAYSRFVVNYLDDQGHLQLQHVIAPPPKGGVVRRSGQLDLFGVGATAAQDGGSAKGGTDDK